MPLFIDGIEVETVIVDGMEMAEVYIDGVLVYEAVSFPDLVVRKVANVPTSTGQLSYLGYNFTKQAVYQVSSLTPTIAWDEIDGTGGGVITVQSNHDGLVAANVRYEGDRLAGRMANPLGSDNYTSSANNGGTWNYPTHPDYFSGTMTAMPTVGGVAFGSGQHNTGNARVMARSEGTGNFTQTDSDPMVSNRFLMMEASDGSVMWRDSVTGGTPVLLGRVTPAGLREVLFEVEWPGTSTTPWAYNVHLDGSCVIAGTTTEIFVFHAEDQSLTQVVIPPFTGTYNHQRAFFAGFHGNIDHVIAIENSGQIHESRDRGQTWTLGPLIPTDGSGTPGNFLAVMNSRQELLICLAAGTSPREGVHIIEGSYSK